MSTPSLGPGQEDRAREVEALSTVQVTRYVTPLREGGSLPGLVEGDDLGTYVCKFHRAGQGPRVLAAEVIVGELARRLGLDTPRQVVLDLGAEIARYEADEEVQDLLTASVGLNLGSDFLPGSFGYDAQGQAGQGGLGGYGAQRGESLEELSRTASTIVWLDALCANVDRSWRNPNLLWWGDALWVIDHGAALYFHHAWAGGLTDPERFAQQPWDPSDHVLIGVAGDLEGADERLSAQVTEGLLREVVSLVPEVWLDTVPGAESPDAVRAAYVAFLAARLGTRQWLPRASS